VGTIIKIGGGHTEKGDSLIFAGSRDALRPAGGNVHDRGESSRKIIGPAKNPCEQKKNRRKGRNVEGGKKSQLLEKAAQIANT